MQHEVYFEGVNKPKIISHKLSKNKIELTFRLKSSSILVTDNKCEEQPDIVWKEIYGVKNGKLKLIKTIKGKHIPAKKVDEQIIF